MRIGHISDIHSTQGTDFNPKIFDKAVGMLNGLHCDFVFVSGDLTTDGLLSEYELAAKKTQEITSRLFVVPGNHDERNLGFKLFPEFFGETDFVHTLPQVTLIGLASSEPDKDDGRLGRGRYRKIEECVTAGKLTIVGFHHHLVPVPGSGRETNIIEDAGETLDLILRKEVPLVLMGHRHVPWAVKIHKTLLVNAGTFSCNRTRAHFGNTFNVIDIDDHQIKVQVMNVRTGEMKTMVEFSLTDGCCQNRYYEPEKNKV
ncbi:MAG: metallophosphoesterase [Candidatus Thermoplasmatota archaeon]|nr:metallophosphoesterase [Candidatus Thermoplasmatota archaeon]